MLVGRRQEDFETGIFMPEQKIGSNKSHLPVKKLDIIEGRGKLAIIFGTAFMLFLFFFGKVENTGYIHIFAHIT